MQTSLIVILYLFSSPLFPCDGNSTLSELMKDPELRAMLKQPFKPRATEPAPSFEELKAKELEEAKSDFEALSNSRNATPAEVERSRRRLARLQDEADMKEFKDSDEFKALMAQPVTLGRLSSREHDVPLDIIDGRIKEVKAQPELPAVYDDSPVTDEQRALFESMLKQPFKPRSSRHPYDNFLKDFKEASPDYPVPAKYRHPLTGEYMDAKVVEFVESSATKDMVRIRYQTPDGRFLTKDVPMTSLQVNDGGRNIYLGNSDSLKESERFGGLDSDTKAKMAVDELGANAVYSAARKRYAELQEKLDSRRLTITEMQAAINEQDNLVRSFSPLRKVEKETVELNLEGLLKGDKLTLTPGEVRAIEQIQEIRDIRHGNAYSQEDTELMDRIKDLSVESVIAGRVKRQRAVIGSEIRGMTGEKSGVSRPFELRNDWSSSRIKRDIGGFSGSTRKKEALDAISAFEKQEQILSSDMSRELNGAIRTLKAELRSKGVTEGPSVDYVRFLELRVQLYELSLK